MHVIFSIVVTMLRFESITATVKSCTIMHIYMQEPLHPRPAAPHTQSCLVTLSRVLRRTKQCCRHCYPRLIISLMESCYRRARFFKFPVASILSISCKRHFFWLLRKSSLAIRPQWYRLGQDSLIYIIISI